MSKLTKLETLEKAVVDTAAAHDAAWTANRKAWENAYAANANFVRAKEKLAAYLKEQDDE